MSYRAPSRYFARLLAAVTAGVIGPGLTGCGGLEAIDRQVGALLIETSADMGADVLPRIPDYLDNDPSRLDPADDPFQKRIPTDNPAATDLTFERRGEVDDVLARLEGYNRDDPNALVLDLEGALGFAMKFSREYRFAEEEYVLDGLRLLIERHLWGPRFFDEITADIIGTGADGNFDTALRLVNEFRVTQRLPYGGDVSARVLARTTEDLHRRVAFENVSDASLILSADVPLLRGAGLVAQDDLIQAERNMIYSARSFERFRREYLFAIAQDFLNLVVQQQNITNGERQLERFEDLEARMVALVEAGREPPFQAALAVQDTLFSKDRLNRQRESYRLGVDRFKVRLALPTEVSLVIDASSLDLPIPEIDINEGVLRGLSYRLDLQNERDQVADSERSLEVALNDLQADLNLRGDVTIPSNPDRDRDIALEIGATNFVAGVTFGLPLDREIERANVRRAQITLERSRRSYEEFRDQVAVNIRSAIREIDRAKFTLELQDENIRTAQIRQASIEAAPDRANARERSDAAQAYLEALDARDGAARDLQVAILGYLLTTGQLRVEADGSLRPLAGM